MRSEKSVEVASFSRLTWFNNHVKKITILALYMVLILMTSLIPMDRDIEGLKFIIHLNPGIQNFLHIPVYAVLAILSLQVMNSYHVTGLRKIFLVTFGAVAFGIFNELVQHWVPGREASLVDVGLNAFGALLGISVYVLAERSRPNILRRVICG